MQACNLLRSGRPIQTYMKVLGAVWTNQLNPKNTPSSAGLMGNVRIIVGNNLTLAMPLNVGPYWRNNNVRQRRKSVSCMTHDSFHWFKTYCWHVTIVHVAPLIQYFIHVCALYKLNYLLTYLTVICFHRVTHLPLHTPLQPTQCMPRFLSPHFSADGFFIV